MANGIKVYICDVKNSRLEHVLPTSINGRVISPNCEGFILVKLRRFADAKFHKNKTLKKFSEFTISGSGCNIDQSLRNFQISGKEVSGSD